MSYCLHLQSYRSRSTSDSYPCVAESETERTVWDCLHFVYFIWLPGRTTKRRILDGPLLFIFIHHYIRPHTSCVSIKEIFSEDQKAYQSSKSSRSAKIPNLSYTLNIPTYLIPCPALKTRHPDPSINQPERRSTFCPLPHSFAFDQHLLSPSQTPPVSRIPSHLPSSLSSLCHCSHPLSLVIPTTATSCSERPFRNCIVSCHRRCYHQNTPVSFNDYISTPTPPFRYILHQSQSTINNLIHRFRNEQRSKQDTLC